MCVAGTQRACLDGGSDGCNLRSTYICIHTYVDTYRGYSPVCHSVRDRCGVNRGRLPTDMTSLGYCILSRYVRPSSRSDNPSR